MRKPVYPISEQQRRRSAQSDQHHCCLLLDGIIPLVSISEISSLYLASVGERAGLCLTWSQTPEDRFSRDATQMFVVFLSDKAKKKVVFTVTRPTLSKNPRL